MTAPDPAVRPGGKGRPSPEPPDRAGRPLRLLVVDDEPGMRLVLGRALARLGYQVFSAGGGLEALDQLRSLKDLDVVVSDVTMPGMTGIDLAHEILRDHPGLPILFVTASSIPDDLLGHPLISLLAKPPRIGELRERVQWLIDRKPAGPGPAAVGPGARDPGVTG